MNDLNVALPLKKFLLIDQCPPDWKCMYLYIFRDETVAFYVGQSQLAFSRVWEHLLSGFHGHSIVGRFLWANWPVSMRFTIELLSSQLGQFDSVGNNRDLAERQLIQLWSPCFNVSKNIIPTPLPVCYQPVNARLRCSRSLNKLIREAERVVRAEETESWVQGID
jgi:hypothetical protein